jgi:heme transport system permease protein
LNKKRITSLGLVAALIVSFFVSINIGSVSISFDQFISLLTNKFTGQENPTELFQQNAILWGIRLPRVLMSLFIGSSLALCGAALQGLFRNPLADPTIIGISSGAMLAAAIVIVLAGDTLFSSYSFAGLSLLSVATFVGAILVIVFIFRIAKEGKKINVMTMLLSGIAINAVAAAGTGLLTYLANDVQLRTLTFWTMGSLGGSTWYNVLIVGACTILTLIFILPLHKQFNALALGEQEAAYIGINTEKLKRRVVIFTALSVGTAVAFCGMIGFVGLVVPHILRLVGGSDHRFLLPTSALAGALLLCWADNFSRTIVAPAEIPIGIITALAGAPIFLYLLLKQKKSTF